MRKKLSITYEHGTTHIYDVIKQDHYKIALM